MVFERMFKGVLGCGTGVKRGVLGLFQGCSKACFRGVCGVFKGVQGCSRVLTGVCFRGELAILVQAISCSNSTLLLRVVRFSVRSCSVF